MKNNTLPVATNKILEVRRLLKLWGDWLKLPGSGYGCRGYPGSVAFIHEATTREMVQVVRPDNPEANRVEQAMCGLKEYDQDAFIALVYEYHLCMTDRDAASRLHIGEATVRNRRAKGEYFIAAKLI